ncbi:hypothetical protein [Planobispora takensis]|uniref:hypothetical protein n=1 Tax=Planobispora takensis TaxID=1367882 RepID=UPI001940622F|nr:hypothetical protein [Planobispora takensis]
MTAPQAEPQPTTTVVVTERVTQSATLTASQAEPQPVASAGAESPIPESGAGSPPLWLWIILAVVVGGLVAWLVYAIRRGSRTERT